VSRDPLGREGDFTTAPEVSQMFGELLGLWAASVWRAIGQPPLLRLIELGPGRGTMMADVLRALRILPPLYQSLTIHMVEVNPVLREKQRATLSGVRNITWHDSIDDVLEGPAVIFANEYFDVLPIHQMVKRETGWHGRHHRLRPSAQRCRRHLSGDRAPQLYRSAEEPGSGRRHRACRFPGAGTCRRRPRRACARPANPGRFPQAPGHRAARGGID